MGDFNIDTLKCHDFHQAQTFVDNFITYGFTLLISKATNFFRSASTSIDHIWCNTICHNTYSGVLNESTSSHKPIFANIPTKINELVTDSENLATFLTQNISAANIEKFESKLHTKLKDIYNDCFEEAVDNNRKRNFVNTPWITLAVTKFCKMKNNKLHNKWIAARGRPNETQAKHEFKAY